MQNNVISKEDIAREIQKHFADVARLRPFSKMVNPAIKVENYGFIPVDLPEYEIRSIEQSPIDKCLYAFSAEGVVLFEDKASGITQEQKVEFGGIARTCDKNGALAIDAVTIDYINPPFPNLNVVED